MVDETLRRLAEECGKSMILTYEDDGDIYGELDRCRRLIKDVLKKAARDARGSTDAMYTWGISDLSNDIKAFAKCNDEVPIQYTMRVCRSMYMHSRAITFNED